MAFAAAVAPIPFAGFAGDQYVKCPVEFFDVLASNLTHAEFKVLAYIIRRTEGFSKEEDYISLSQFQFGIVTKSGERLDHGCGIRRRDVIVAAIRKLEIKRIIKVVRSKTAWGDDEVSLFSINRRKKPQRQNRRPTPPPPAPDEPPAPDPDAAPDPDPAPGSPLPSDQNGDSPSPDSDSPLPGQPQEGVTESGDNNTTRNQNIDGQKRVIPEDIQSIWEGSFSLLEIQTPKDAFNRWLRGARLLEYLEEGVMVLGVPNIYAQQWLENRLKKTIVRTLTQIAGRHIDVAFRLLTSDGA